MSSKTKSLINKESLKYYIEFLKQTKTPFTLKISNYTTEISSTLFNVQFMQSMRSKQMFSAYKKIQADVKGTHPPDVDMDEIKYFEHDFKKDFFSLQDVVNIDLKSAYATALFNKDIISTETFKYLQRLPKQDRLASVGMLASKKHVFTYNNKGEIASYSKIVSPLENFFYYAVREVQQTMEELKRIAANNYLFSWVDGIYILRNEETLQKIKNHLHDTEYKYSIDELKYFKVKISQSRVCITFEKDEDEKIFNIPIRENVLANDIINYLINKKPLNYDLQGTFIRKQA